MKSVALLVHACDRYEFLFKGFEYFFRKSWDFNIPCKCYFGTEDISHAIEGFTNIRTGEGEWSNRLLVLLDNLEEEYILLLQEDMWLSKPVSGQFFEKLFDEIKSQDFKQVKLHSSETYSTVPTSIFIEGLNLARVEKPLSKFLMSHQITLWEKVFLKQQLPKGEHPWRNERKGTKRLRNSKQAIFQIDCFSLNGKTPNNQNHENAMISGYSTVSVNARLNESALPFILELKDCADVDLRAYGEKLETNFNNKTTHDGKSEPRKIDVFKKLKNLLRGR